MSPTKHEQMRNLNTLSVLDFIRQHGQSTRRDIQTATGLSWAAVSTISTDLIAKNILKESAYHGHLAGRNPAYLNFSPMRNLTIGMELNAEGLTVLLLGLRCEVIDSRIEAIRSLERDDVLQQMLGAVEAILEANRLNSRELLGIGIAVQGSVDREGSTALYNSFFRDWKNVPLKKICEERFGVEVRIIHDPVCIILAEQWRRRLLGEDCALVRLSFGIGMGYLAGGVPILGHTGAAGELGHMVLNPNGPLCSCGNRGCMESYCSIRGLTRRILDAAKLGELALPEALCTGEENSVDYMKRMVAWAADGASNGNKLLRRLFDEAGEYLGLGIANIVSLFNPSKVILTGELLQYQKLFLPHATKAAHSAAWMLSEFEILLLEEGRLQASVGAALHFINNAFESQDSRLLA